MGLKGSIYVTESAIEKQDALNGRLVINDVKTSDIFYDTSDISIKNNIDKFNLIVNDNNGNFKYNDVIMVTSVNEYTLFSSTVKCLNINFNITTPHNETDLVQLTPIIKDIIIYKSVCMIVFTPAITEDIRNQYKEFMYMDNHYYRQQSAKIYRYYDNNGNKLAVGYCIFATTDKIGSKTEIEELIKTYTTRLTDLFYI